MHTVTMRTLQCTLHPGSIHFSNNDKKFGKKGRGRNGKGRTREIQLTNVRNAL